MSSKTYQKIIETSIEVLNEKGLSNTSMRDISDRMGISIGNLSYHFKSKEDLIIAILATIKSDIALQTAKIQNIPTLQMLFTQWIPWLSLYGKYRFVVIDQVEIIRQFPRCRTEIENSVKKQIEFLRYVLSYLVGSDVMKKPKNSIVLDKLAENIWLYLNFWMTQSFVRGHKLNIRNFIQDSKISLSLMLYPYLTEKGKEEQKQFQNLLTIEDKSIIIDKQEELF